MTAGVIRVGCRSEKAEFRAAEAGQRGADEAGDGAAVCQTLHPSGAHQTPKLLSNLYAPPTDAFCPIVCKSQTSVEPVVS